MTRILIHSCSPWDPTGYGTQCAQLAMHLQGQGHDVAISAYHGSPGCYTEWQGIPVYPPPLAGPVTALIRGHATHWKAELVLILADVWLMDPKLLDGFRTGIWLPSDTNKIALGDFYHLRSSGATPIAMSLDGKAKLERAGWEDVLYVPHMIDTDLFAPPADKGAARERLGIPPGAFAIGINGNNIDPVRKAYPEQLAAFERFHGKHPDSVMTIHTIADMRSDGSLDLGVLCADLGLKPGQDVLFCDQYTNLAGQYTAQDMAAWYGALDVVSNATYGEGFGLPAIEGQACGTPVIVSDGTSGRQLAGPAKWLVRTQRRWNWVHGAWWHAPSEDAILARYEQAYLARGAALLRVRCREFALGYSTQVVGPMWDEVIAKLTGDA